MGFILILLITTLSIAGTAAFFSIYGLAQIFAASFWPVVIMASSLEVGKLVSASYLYRYWTTISLAMKVYLTSAVAILMLITSIGVFGFLSGAYQTDTIGLREIESRIELLNLEKNELYERKNQIDEDVSRIGANYITKRMELIDKYSPETSRINNRIPAITAEIHELKKQQIKEESHVGPIIYIAKVFDREADDATKWLMLLIIFVFDPLAVALTIATNNVMLQYKNQKQGKDRPTKKEANSSDFFDEEEDDYDNDEFEYELDFSEDDLIESIDELELDLDDSTEEVIENINDLFPSYNITDKLTAEKLLTELTEKLNSNELTVRERKQFIQMQKMLQQLKLAQLIKENRKT